ncbi:hypothetical protein SK236_26895 [Pseudomonas aeruginosa]|nr:hypothetical protein [Pseudomonas aeruginosa]
MNSSLEARIGMLSLVPVPGRLDTPAIGEATSEIRTGGTHAQLQPATTTASAASSTATE